MMKIQSRIVTLVITCISGLSLNIVINQRAVAQTASQIKKMRDAGVPVVLPSNIPVGFKLKNFNINVSGGVHEYAAIYLGPNNCEFSIMGTDQGSGAADEIRQWDVNNPLFGKFSLMEFKDPTGSGPNYLEAFVPPGRKGLPKKAGYMTSFMCKNSIFSSQKALEILKSLQMVK